MTRATAGLFPLMLAALGVTGCGHDVPAQELEVVLDYDGVRHQGVIAFPAHDDDDNAVSGDDTCGWTTGNCGEQGYAEGTLVQGDLPFEGARLTSSDDGAFRTYDVFLRRSPEDAAAEAAAAAASPYVPRNRFACRVSNTELGHPTKCYGTTRACVITLSVR
jgi:hypothetical protein